MRAWPSAATTTYANDYSRREDRHELLETSDPIASRTTCPRRGGAPTRSSSVRCTGATSLPETLGDRCRASRGIDLQGLVRLADARGTRLAPNPELKDYLAQVSVAKASEEELAVLLEGRSLEEFRSEFGLAELLVTRGDARRAGRDTLRVSTRSRVPRVARRFPVGAGDVFLAAYLHARASEPRPRSTPRASRCA